MVQGSNRHLDRLLSDKQRAFWVLQIFGWLAYALLRSLSQEAFGMGLYSSIAIGLATATGFCLTLIMASVFRRLINRGGLALWLVGGGTVVICAALFSALEIWAHITWVDPGFRPATWEYLSVALFDLYVLTSWAGLYFGINYYLMAQTQRRRLLELTAEAHAAQLKMLRYQLNPHFLFNTLNSISTLVLMKDTVNANAMLTRLSAFLRYSLAGEPSSTVPLAQEIEALKLYLDIESARFQDRLKVEFAIDPAARGTQLPSLLLQPLVENAIKYAVAPQEDGAEIRISAQVEGDRVRLVVADTGPGLTADAPSKGSGVGLANTRERLAQLYGDQGRLHVLPNQPVGLAVSIDIPANGATTDLMEAAE
jgi:two-component system, LytTR family, sensor kinase